MKIIILLTSIVSLLISASFDCYKAQTKIEKAICEDSQLNLLDTNLNVAYKSAIKYNEQGTFFKNLEPKSGIVFTHKDWYVETTTVGKEWIEEFNDYTYHIQTSACTKIATDERFCINKHSGTTDIYVTGARSIQIGPIIFNKLNYQDYENTPTWINDLANSKDLIYIIVNKKKMLISPDGSSAALRYIGLIK